MEAGEKLDGMKKNDVRIAGQDWLAGDSGGSLRAYCPRRDVTMEQECGAATPSLQIPKHTVQVRL